jgi:hypothetical protein
VSAGPERELRAVDPVAPEPDPEASPAAREHEARSAPWLVALLLAALLVVGVGFALERGRADALEGEVAALQGRLETAEGSLAVARSRMGVVRAHVADLASRIGLLQDALSEPLSKPLSEPVTPPFAEPR